EVRSIESTGVDMHPFRARAFRMACATLALVGLGTLLVGLWIRWVIPLFEDQPLRETSPTSINLSHRAIDAQTWKSLQGSKAVRALDLCGTWVTDNEILSIASLHTLRELDLSLTLITDDGVKHLQQLINLERLNLNYTKVTDHGLAHLPRKLRQLSIFA